jgi:endonuclease YncB( thermonuclease family)
MFGLSLPCRVIDVTDGDTVVCEIKRTIRIRLVDCWAPELRDEGGIEAKRFLEKLVDGKDVTLQIELEPDGRFGDRMTFGRILGRVLIDGKDASELMVDAGHATKKREG